MIAKSTLLLALASTALVASRPVAVERTVEPFEELSLTFEVNVNDVDGEVILHAETGKPLERMMMFGPHGKVIQALHSERGGLGISEFRIESGEPKIAEVRAQFPEGEYLVRGQTIEGGWVEGRVQFSHRVPARCSILAPAPYSVLDRQAVQIEWAGDTSVSHFTLEIEGADDDRAMVVRLPGDVTSFRVPGEVLQPGFEYQIVLVSESEHGNRTVQESYFHTAR